MIRTPRRLTRFAVFGLTLLLAGCGTLPQPFLGKPGREGAVLAIPPPPILIVPPPRTAMLGDHAAHLYAADLASALVDQNVPCVARPAHKNDWRLRITASLVGATIIPHFTLIGPNGKAYGHYHAAPLAAADWAAGTQASLQASAKQAAAPLAQRLAQINAQVQHSNPASLENRPARVKLVLVTGAPGDGDHALALDFRRALPKLNIVVAHHTDRADFLVTGHIRVTPQTPGRDLVELDWVVRDRNHHFIGKVSQLHALKPSDMVPYWGDVAAAAAEQAARGVQQVILNAKLNPASPAPATKAAPATSTPPHAAESQAPAHP
jgi:hypothetical protein